MSYDDAATVITPFSWGSAAIELGNRRWSKRVLPVGDVQYQGRTLHFTPSYISGLVDAWRDQAYDQVPLQLADASNKHTNDPERTRGWITGMEAKGDGLWVTAELTPAGEAVISENPALGISARIVENYQRSDGKFYPAAIQHVLGTLDPRIPQLGSWQAVDMSNAPQLTVDLSNSVWLGEPGPPEYAEDELTDAEFADLIEAMTEADAEAALDSGYRYDAGAAAALSDFDATWQHQLAAEQAREQFRQAADMEDLMRPPRNDEDVIARAIARAGQGIYDSSHAASFASPSIDAIELSTELTMATGQGLCGSPDPFGRCSSRYHDSQCIHGVGTDWQASEPPRSTYETVLSNFADRYDLGGTPASYGDGDEQHPIPQRTLDFAHALNASWGMHTVTPAPTADELFSASYGARQDAYSAMAAELGRPDLADGPQLPGDGYPDVSELARQMGLK